MAVGERGKTSGFLTKILIILAVIVLAAILIAIIREIGLKKQVNQEIEKLKAEAEKIERENTSLSDKISYLESVDYQEKEARDKLSLQGQGENVVIIKPSPAKELVTINEEGDRSETKIVVVRSNIEKWWDHFFKY